LNFEEEFFMKKALTILLALGVLLCSTATSLAHGNGQAPVARKRQHEQQQRIRQGIRSDELTKREVRGLTKEQREIQQEIRQAKSDGVVTPGERREIWQEQNQASRHIYRAKHNRRDRN
jgi:high-affinity K+ transport system ATPase subunit B